MNDFKSLLNALNMDDETQQTQIPFKPQASMPDSLAQAALAEANPAPVMPKPSIPAPQNLESAPQQAMKALDALNLDRSPASQSMQTTDSLHTKISGTAPGSDSINGSESAEGRLERLMRDLKDQSDKARDEAASRKFKADIVKSLTDNAGTFVGGMQAKNTGAHVTPTQTHGYDVGDLVGQVDKRYAGDREALMDQYKMLLNARDRGDQRKFQQDSLSLQKRGLAIKQQLADKKGVGGLTEGQKAVDKDFGKKYAEWNSNGKASADTNIKKLQEVYDELSKLPKNEQEENDRFIGKLPDWAQDQDKIQRREKVRSAAQEALRATLGAQFTEKEGESIMNRSYDPTLSPKANMERIKTVLDERIQARNEKNKQAGEFENKGTLSQYSPTPSSIVPNSTISNETVKIQGPSGQIAEVSADKAEKYLAKPGYKKVD